jgi:hypothetical protein
MNRRLKVSVMLQPGADGTAADAPEQALKGANIGVASRLRDGWEDRGMVFSFVYLAVRALHGLVSEIAGIAGDVHPASTTLSMASASRSETACSRLSRAR